MCNGNSGNTNMQPHRTVTATGNNSTQETERGAGGRQVYRRQVNYFVTCFYDIIILI